jgi:hypothetical protein
MLPSVEAELLFRKVVLSGAATGSAGPTNDAETDPAGNLKPSREKSTDRIDGIAAWCDALFARHVAGEPADEVSAYETVRTILT